MTQLKILMFIAARVTCSSAKIDTNDVSILVKGGWRRDREWMVKAFTVPFLEPVLTPEGGPTS